MLTPAMSARNRKRRKLLRTLRRHGVTGAGLHICGCIFALFGWFVSGVVSDNSPRVDLRFKHVLPDELPADWTEFPAEVVEKLAKEAVVLFGMLNVDQRASYQTIIDCVLQEKSGIFFVSGYGGTGKTFLWNAIISHLRGRKKSF
ncbi:hypothetical protein VPH35_036707 [Triticum aestivum]|uniref:ATP-dependent DNA helicase n=2 Tax=Aegilops tauschii subsp. strangulata TaxID=200361 RepID=A0A453BIR2_AEGTS